METIKSYIENMFLGMPNTEAVLKAKAELLQMMEDKYNELIAEGLNENTAIGTVISEFGNLDELAEELGLNEEVDLALVESENANRYHISLEEAKDFIAYRAKSGLMVGMGVFLCIVSVTGVLISELLKISEIIGISLMFGMIAVAVGLFIYNGVSGSRWDHIKKYPCQIDLYTANYLNDEKDRYRSTHALRLTCGIVLCVICWLPTVALSAVKVEELGAIMLFVLVGIGVLLIVHTNIINGSFDKLLKVNADGTIGATYRREDEVEYINNTIKLIMDLYWSVISAIYLIWSFITFQWWRTWIIWPIAGIIFAVLKSNLRKK